MEDSKQNPGQPLSPEQVASIAGGDGTSCPAPTTTVNVPPISYQTPGTPGDAMVAVYEGFVEITSYVIERLANTAK